MNWRHRVHKAITGVHNSYVYLNDDVIAVIDKCRLKYRSKDKGNYSINHIKNTKRYCINGYEYRVVTELITDVGRHKNKRVASFSKNRKHLYGSYSYRSVCLRMEFDSFWNVPERYKHWLCPYSKNPVVWKPVSFTSYSLWDNKEKTEVLLCNKIGIWGEV